jgi:glycosyltransferase involved in cell wall biosynthesis
MRNKVFIHATNVHQGGGRSLLEALLEALGDRAEYVLSLDDRMPVPAGLMRNVQIQRVKPTVWHRLGAERRLALRVAPDDIVLCFGNLPPLFRLHGHTVVFVQNLYLIGDVSLSGFPFKVRLRIAIERFWFSRKTANVSQFIVQTPAMKKLLDVKTRGKVPVRVLPFVAEPNGYLRASSQAIAKKNSNYDFVYVASGEPHKNHLRLVEAWCQLAGEGCFPSLCLTLEESRFSGLCREIEVMRQKYGLKVVNVGQISHQCVLELYKNSGALIFPSLFESFGLPLIEARQENLAVLASESDFVRDVLDPEQTFDPKSSISIARAVKRFLGIGEQPLPLLDAVGFLESALAKAE